MPNMKNLSWTTKKVTARTRFVTDAGTDLTLRSKFKVKGHQQWYATHRLEVVYLHAKYEKPVLNDKKVTARTRFVMDAQTSLTLRSKFKVKGHQQWHATHHLEVVYLHTKYAKPVLNDKKVTARTRFVTDGQTDHCMTSATKWRSPNYIKPTPFSRIFMNLPLTVVSASSINNHKSSGLTCFKS